MTIKGKISMPLIMPQNGFFWFLGPQLVHFLSIKSTCFISPLFVHNFHANTMQASEDTSLLLKDIFYGALLTSLHNLD